MKLFHIPQAKLNRMKEIGLVQSTNPSFIWGERLLLVVNGHNVWDCRVQRRNNLVVITASTSRKSNRSNSWELTTSTKKTSLPQESNRRSHGRESTCSSETEGEKSEHRNHQCVEKERLSSTTKLSWPQWHSLPRRRSRTIHRTVKTNCFHYGKSLFPFLLSDFTHQRWGAYSVLSSLPPGATRKMTTSTLGRSILNVSISGWPPGHSLLYSTVRARCVDCMYSTVPGTVCSISF
jgi:hypothetical protein